jgi:hypothetical protein
VTWCELVEHFGKGYYLVEIPAEVHRRYFVPDKQYIRTPAYFEPSRLAHRVGAAQVPGAECTVRRWKRRHEPQEGGSLEP